MFPFLFLISLWTAHGALDPKAICVQQLKKISGPISATDLKSACEQTGILEGCQSEKGKPIFHYERKGTRPTAQRILAKALIHGDEGPSGFVARAWMVRLSKIDPRNTWRVIPVANPDGWEAKTRMNSRGVDLNRNFPTKDWDQAALKYWKTKMKSDPRRYPGPKPGSEAETRCLLKQFKDFKPNFLISIHTPLGVLDFDGPPVRPPAFKPLPWLSLGNFPGSLGRYMWVDNRVPVLTIELKGNEDLKKLESFDRLQDISGTIAIQTDQLRTQASKGD